MNRYQVVVGNIGTVYDGPDESKAREKFSIYKKDSQDGYGRAAGEPVCIIANYAHGNSDIIADYEGTNNDAID